MQDIDEWDPSDAVQRMHERLRPACRLRAGQTSLDCPPGSAGDNGTGRLDLGDLVSTEEGREVWGRALAVRYEAEATGASVAEALTAFHAIVDPAIDQLNRERDGRAVLETEETEILRFDTCDCPDDDYSIDGGTRSASATRRDAAAQLGMPSQYRGAVPARDDDEDTDDEEDTARAAMVMRSRDSWRSTK